MQQMQQKYNDMVMRNATNDAENENNGAQGDNLLEELLLGSNADIADDMKLADADDFEGEESV